MQKSFLWTLVAIAVGGCLYYLLASLLLPWAPALAPQGGGHLALQLSNTAVLIAISLPFAIALAWATAPWRGPTLVALAIALLGLVAPVLPNATLVFQPGSTGLSAAADLIKFTLLLPLLTWLAVRWLPSNKSFNPMPLRGTG